MSEKPPPSAAPPQVASQASPTQPAAALQSVESPDYPQSSVTFAQSPRSSAASILRPPESPRTSISESRAVKSAKVAIPRLKRSSEGAGEGTTRSGGRHRVNHACEPCRHRKTKCSGERPVCRHCQDFKITCYFADGKRDRAKKQFGSMAEKVADYEKILRELLLKVDDADATKIKALLEKDPIGDFVPDADQKSNAPGDGDAVSESGGEESVASAGKGSTGALDRTEEDFTRDDARDTGFIGKNSEITWLQRLRQENAYGTPDTPEEEADFQQRVGGASPLGAEHTEPDAPNLPEVEDAFAIHNSSYHLDDLAISTFDAVDPHEMPTPETARHLFHSYMARVHPTYPIVGKSILTSQFHKFVAGRIQNPPNQWLAIVNLIFAIGAKYSHLIQAEWEADDRDHLIYFSRARLLALNGESIFTHPDLQHIQVVGLMAFYLLCTNQINRAWTISGMALRSATALGLNMRNESTKLADHLKEIRYRVWWALYTLEHRLCSMTGRMNCILDDHCTTPLPIPLEEEAFHSEGGKVLLRKDKQAGDRNPATPVSNSSTTPSSDRSRSVSKPESSRSPSTNQLQDMDWAKNVTPNASLYFLHLVQLTRVSQRTYHQLYTPATVTGSWSDIQTMISDLDNSVENWYRALPGVFDFKRQQREREFYQYRIALGFAYHGIKITISRPCLCRLDRKMPNQSSKSDDFNRTQAANCIENAKELLSLIPDVPNAVGLNSVGPWWSLLHWLVQATSVLMLEMSFRSHHMPTEADNIFEAAKKAVRWMHQLGAESFAARRAWLLCNSMLRESAAKIGREVNDLPTTAPEGRGSTASQGGHSSNTSMTAMMEDNFHQPTIPSLFSASQQAGMSALNTFGPYDPLMQYDQYFPETQGQQQRSHDVDMEFLSNNEYHDDNQRGPGNDVRAEGPLQRYN